MARTYREYSKKRLALEQAYGRPWADVAREWSRKPYNQSTIGRLWTAAVQPLFPDVAYSQQDVSEIMRRAAEQEGQAVAA